MKHKKAYVVCATALVVLALAAVIGPRIGIWLVLRDATRENAVVWKTPTPLADQSVSHKPGRTFSYFGYEFEAPWTEVKFEAKYEKVALLRFSNGAGIVFINPAYGIDMHDAMSKEATKRGTSARALFGDVALQPNYDLRSRMLYVTPRDVNLFSLDDKKVGNAILLVLKSLMTEHKGGLYSFRSGWLRGFQNGAIDMDGRVDIVAFDATDRELELHIYGNEKGNAVSQGDVNRIVFSLHASGSPPQGECVSGAGKEKCS